jgi:hypothetical protein
VALGCLALAAALPARAATPRLRVDPYPLDTVLRLNDVQAVGTHNSYHLRPPAAAQVTEWDYEHSPLDVQLGGEGVRQFELDLYYDPSGFFRVHHLSVLDALSSCPRLVECLEAIERWSRAHPHHHPLAVFLEPKGFYLPDQITDEPIPGTYDALDAEIRSVFPDWQLITPDEIRGGAATLADGVRANGWPRLAEARGRVLLVMLDEGADRAGYAEGRPSLEGRAMFVTSSEGRADAAVFKVDGPEGSGFDRIRNLVREGFLVRTRADSDGDEARANDTSRLEAALASGAHWISTDYPVAGRIPGSPYVAEIPGGEPSGCNPVIATALCSAPAIENPLYLDRRVRRGLASAP